MLRGMGRRYKGGECAGLSGTLCPASTSREARKARKARRASVWASCLLASVLFSVLLSVIAQPALGTARAEVTLFRWRAAPLSASTYERSVDLILTGSSLEGSIDCGLARLVRVRTLDGAAVAGVTVRLEARPASSGGPETYSDRTAGCPADARPVLTGTLIAHTDTTGLARFERPGPGLWTLWMEGETEGNPISPRGVQGTPPYGTNPPGGGHLELLDPYNEHVSGLVSGDVPGAPVEPAEAMEAKQLASASASAGAGTSNYVLVPSYTGWVPALDLASGSDPPQPLSSLPLLPVSRPLSLAVSTPAPAQSARKGLETAGPRGDALLWGTPVVVGTVAPVADGVEFPQGGSTGARPVGALGGRIVERVLLLFGVAIVGAGLLLLAATHAGRGNEGRRSRRGRRNRRERRDREGQRR